MLREKINFINPVDCFTIYAFLNYTGYDRENHLDSEGNYIYHPVRKGVREDLSKMDLNLKNPKYYNMPKFQNYGLESDLASIVGYIGEAPNFKIDPRVQNIMGENIHRDLKDFDSYLNEFYREANIDKLYKKYQPYYQEVINSNKEEVYKYLGKMVRHFNIDLKSNRDFDICINLMDMYWRGYMIDGLKIDPNNQNPVLLITGPTPENKINIHNIVHEFAHIYEAPIIRSKPKEYKNLELALFKTYGIDTGNDFYRTWDKIVDESIVRAISTWVMGENKSNLKHEVDNGFVMAEYIYDRIDDFKGNPNLTFEKWLLSVLQGYADELMGPDATDEDKWIRLEGLENIGTDKALEINFSKSIDFEDIYAISIVKDNKFIAHNIELDQSKTKAIAKAVKNYEKGSTYNLRIVLKNGKKYEMKFKTRQ